MPRWSLWACPPLGLQHAAAGNKRHAANAASVVWIVCCRLCAPETRVLQDECCRLMHPLRVQERYEEGYGTVLDSGTTFTYLPTDAFQSFKEAVTAFALEHGLKSVKGPDPKVSACCPQPRQQGLTQARNTRGLPHGSSSRRL